jgi:hypothetical protein
MKRILPVYTQETDPKINPERTKAELLRFQIELKQTSINAKTATYAKKLPHLTRLLER